MKKTDEVGKEVSRIHRYLQDVCGLYSRVARKLGVDRSYVSRVAAGERRSPAIERAIISEFGDSQQNPGA